MVGIHGQAERVKVKFDAMRPLLDERSRRLWAAVEAKAIGRGGISWVAEATGMSRGTVRVGLQELAALGPASGEHLGRSGAGRKRLTGQAPELAEALERKLDPVTCGDSMTTGLATQQQLTAIRDGRVYRILLRFESPPAEIHSILFINSHLHAGKCQRTGH